MRVWRTRFTVVVLCVAGATYALAAATHAQSRSIQQLMIQHIDPAADTLWGAVGLEETARGTHERAPATNAKWDALIPHAQAVIDGAEALKHVHLPVGGKTHGLLADASTPGIRSAQQIRADIDRDPAKFAAAADRLQRAGRDALSAVVARDAARLTVAGAAMDGACESCHAAYWYPRQRLTLPSADAFGRKAIHP